MGREIDIVRDLEFRANLTLLVDRFDALLSDIAPEIYNERAVSEARLRIREPGGRLAYQREIGAAFKRVLGSSAAR